jgi:hypothetical protein
MFQDVSSEAVESKIPVAPSHSSLFDDVYNSVSTALHTLKETAEEHPYASATLGLAMGASMLYLTKGKLWGVASETSPFKWTNSIGIEKTICSPKQPALLEAIERAGKGPLVLNHEQPHFMRIDWLRSSPKPRSDFALDHAKALRVRVSPDVRELNMFPQSPNRTATSLKQGAEIGAPGSGGLAAVIGKQMVEGTKRFGV